MEYFNLILGQIALPATVIAALTYLAKFLITQVMARDIEHYKTSMSKDMEDYKRRLDFAHFERQTRFASTHQRRADVIIDLYAQIADVEQKFRAMLSPLQLGFADIDQELKRKSDQKRDAIGAFNLLQSNFRKNRIFFGAQIASQIDELITLLHHAWIDFDEGGVGQDKDSKNYRLEAWNKISKEFPPIQRELECKFHDILGIAN